LTFVYRYAGLCAVQYLMGAPPFSPESVLVDLPNCFSVVGRMDPGEADGFLLPEKFMGGPMVLGPFRAGLTSAGICFGYEIEKIKVYLRALLGTGEQTEALAERGRALSIADSGIKSAVDLVDALISKSGPPPLDCGRAWL
jgi:hypothetical protein